MREWEFEILSVGQFETTTIVPCLKLTIFQPWILRHKLAVSFKEGSFPKLKHGE